MSYSWFKPKTLGSKSENCTCTGIHHPARRRTFTNIKIIHVKMFGISNMFWESILPHDCVPLIPHQLSYNSTEHFTFTFKLPYCHLLRLNLNVRGHIEDIHIFYMYPFNVVASELLVTMAYQNI